MKTFAISAVAILLMVPSGKGQNLWKIYEQDNRIKFKETISKNPSLIYKRNGSGENILHLLAYSESSNSSEYLEMIVTTIEDVSINVVTDDEYKMTPLMCACLMGNVANAEILIKYGADVNAFGDSRMTALHWGGDIPEIVELLVENGANVNAKTSGGRTPLMFIAADGNVDIARNLIEHGAMINDKDNYGSSAIIFASGEPLRSGVPPNVNLDFIELLIEHGVDVNSQDLTGMTPLMVACREGHKMIVTSFLENNANIDMQDNNGRTALFYAAYNNYTEILKILVHYESDTNITDTEGHNAFYYAKKGKCKDAAEYLGSLIP